MASGTKTTLTAFPSSATNTAGSTTSSSVRDASTSLGEVVYWKITNGGTGPTIACSVYLDWCDDSTPTTNKPIRSATAGTTNSAAYEGSWRVPPECKFYRLRFTGNTAQSVTVEGWRGSLDSIA